MALAVRGLIEGFYGRPWTWDERMAVARQCVDLGLTHYVYAPKDDPLHRQQWRQPYGSADLAGFAALAGDSGLALGFAISPGLDLQADDPEDQSALNAKVDAVVTTGASLVVLAFDDLPTGKAGPGQRGEEHAAVANRLVDHLAGQATVALVPTDYTGTTPTRYLDALRARLAPEVPIGWTGPFVVNDSITVDDARARADALGGRPPLLWDNYPVNDAFMSDRLFLGPLRGRDPAMAGQCWGYLANAMVQPHANELPLASVGAFCRGEDPEEAWRAVADQRGLTNLAEACDGARPQTLVAAVVDQDLTDGHHAGGVDELRRWLEQAAGVTSSALGAEADGWARQVGAEAAVGLAALRLLEAVAAGDQAKVAAEAVLIGLTWPKLRRDDHTVMGPRLSVRPVFGQDPEGDWVFHPTSVQEDANAIDRLVRFALGQAGS